MVRVNSFSPNNVRRNPIRRLLLPKLAGSFLLIVFFGNLHQALAQEVTPAGIVQQFKERLNENDFPGACKLMAETDQSGPLKLKHYEQMQLSLEGLAKMWAGAMFSIGNEQLSAETQPPSAIVPVTLAHPNQEVKMKLLKFDSSWYIVDIEIFFK